MQLYTSEKTLFVIKNDKIDGSLELGCKPTHFENHLCTSQTVSFQFPYSCESWVGILAQIHGEGKAQ